MTNNPELRLQFRRTAHGSDGYEEKAPWLHLQYTSQHWDGTSSDQYRHTQRCSCVGQKWIGLNQKATKPKSHVAHLARSILGRCTWTTPDRHSQLAQGFDTSPAATGCKASTWDGRNSSLKWNRRCSWPPIF